MKANAEREDAPTQVQVSDAGPAAYFKAHHLKKLTSKHGQEFMKINSPLPVSLAPITSVCHLLPLCVSDPSDRKSPLWLLFVLYSVLARLVLLK